MNLLQAGLVLAGICGMAGPVVPPKAAEGPRTVEQIQELIVQLGVHEFRTREQAAAALEQQGDAALPALRQALAESRDLEIRVRAERLIAAIEHRNRARHALQRILTRAQASKEPPSDKQVTHALYLLALGRPATAEELQDGEKLLKAAAQRETALAEWIDQLQKHPDYNKSLAEARLQLQDFRVEVARDGEAAILRALQTAKYRDELPIRGATKTIMTTIKPLDQRAGIDLMFLMSIARLPTAKDYAEVEKQLQPPKPNYAQVQLSDFWWALLNSNEFLLDGQPQPSTP